MIIEARSLTGIDLIVCGLFAKTRGLEACVHSRLGDGGEIAYPWPPSSWIHKRSPAPCLCDFSSVVVRNACLFLRACAENQHLHRVQLMLDLCLRVCVSAMALHLRVMLMRLRAGTCLCEWLNKNTCSEWLTTYTGEN